MTLASPQHVTPQGLVFKVQREAYARCPYPDGKFLTGPRKDELKYSQGIGCQTNYKLSREVRKDDPPIDLREAVEWLVDGVAMREVDVNRALTVAVKPEQFDALCSCYFQKGNVPLPDGAVFLKEVGGLFNAGDPVRAMASFMRFNCGASNIPTAGHTKRRAAEILMSFGDYGDQSKFPAFMGAALIGKEMWSTDELIALIKEVDPQR